MSQTALSYLNGLASSFTPSATYFDAAKRHRASIELRLDLWLGVSAMFETGSLRHGTGVWGHSDVDYFVSLTGERPTPQTALNRVRDALADRFTQTTVRVSRPAVVCEFVSGSETVEVVPAYLSTNGDGYWIPDPQDASAWMRAYPTDHNQYVNAANTSPQPQGAAKKLARLAKVWKYTRGVPISSCYLEMRAAKYVVDLGSSPWVLPMDLHYYLQELRRLNLAAMNDPTHLGGRFSACSSQAKRYDALSKLDTALIRSQKACDAYRDGYDMRAIEQWALVFNQ